MHRTLFTVAAALLFLFHAEAAPRGGGFVTKVKFPAGSEEKPARFDFEKSVTFLAGQRACVIVTGRSAEAPAAKLTLLILDEKGNTIASDDGAYNLTAIFFPRRDTTCTIRVLNPDSHDHDAYLTVK